MIDSDVFVALAVVVAKAPYIPELKIFKDDENLCESQQGPNIYTRKNKT